MDKELSMSDYKTATEYWKDRALKDEQEIERLKELIKEQFYNSQIPAYVQYGYSNTEAREKVNDFWNEFKTENKL